MLKCIVEEKQQERKSHHSSSWPSWTCWLLCSTSHMPLPLCDVLYMKTEKSKQLYTKWIQYTFLQMLPGTLQTHVCPTCCSYMCHQRGVNCIVFLIEMQHPDWWCGLHKSLYRCAKDLRPDMTRSGTLGSCFSCNNTAAIQSWQRITSMVSHRITSIKPTKCCHTLLSCNIWGSSGQITESQKQLTASF